MSDYAFDGNDGKVHTRYSELMRCTPGRIERVVAEREGLGRFQNEDMEFGTVRHDMWAQEAKETGIIASCFDQSDFSRLAWGGPARFSCADFPTSHIEEEFVTEMLPGVIVHSRPDVVCAEAETVVDYKTLVAKDLEQGFKKAHSIYNYSRQLPFYAFQLGLNGIRITRAIYLVEIWDKERENIMGYRVVDKRLHMSDIGEVVAWAHARAALLVSALEGRVAA